MEIILNDVKIVDRLQDGGYGEILQIIQGQIKKVTDKTKNVLYIGYLRPEKKFAFLIYSPTPDEKGNCMKLYIHKSYRYMLDYFFLRAARNPKNKEYYDGITSFLIDMSKRMQSMVYG